MSHKSRKSVRAISGYTPVLIGNFLSSTIADRLWIIKETAIGGLMMGVYGITYAWGMIVKGNYKEALEVLFKSVFGIVLIPAISLLSIMGFAGLDERRYTEILKKHEAKQLALEREQMRAKQRLLRKLKDKMGKTK
jgi:hypothetical protein